MSRPMDADERRIAVVVADKLLELPEAVIAGDDTFELVPMRQATTPRLKLGSVRAEIFKGPNAGGAYEIEIVVRRIK